MKFENDVLLVILICTKLDKFRGAHSVERLELHQFYFLFFLSNFVIAFLGAKDTYFENFESRSFH